MSKASVPHRVRDALHHGAVVAVGLLAVVYGLRMLLADPVDDAVRTVVLAALTGAVVAVRRYRSVATDGA